jgi:subtilisin family serine protease
MRIALLIIPLLLVPMVDALEVATRGAYLQGSDEYGDGAWDMGYYGCGVTIAIFDEGIDDKHPWLDGKVVAGVDTTDTSVFWTAANGGNPQPIVGSHGTPVAGMAGSHYGMPFFAPEDAPDWPADARLGSAPCAWLVDVQFNDISGASAAEMIAAFDWAIENVDNDWEDDIPSNDGIEIITMSWSPEDESDGSTPVCEAANRAAEAGIIVLGSAGNSGGTGENTLGCPTGADGSLSIANTLNQRTVTRDDDVITPSSSFGPRTDDGDANLYEELKPDISAPGTDVISTNSATGDGSEYGVACIQADDIPEQSPTTPPGTCSTYFGGTSAATPFVAGMVAVLLDANKNLTLPDIREILHQTGEPFPGQEPSFPWLHAKYHVQMAYGMLDAKAAVQLALVWPGIELGADTDGDGVRDYRDENPFNATLTGVVAPRLGAAGGAVDSDGDGVVDMFDAAPLDPSISARGDDPENTNQESPAIGLVALLGLLVLVGRRR